MIKRNVQIIKSQRIPELALFMDIKLETKFSSMSTKTEQNLLSSETRLTSAIFI